MTKERHEQTPASDRCDLAAAWWQRRSPPWPWLPPPAGARPDPPAPRRRGPKLTGSITVSAASSLTAAFGQLGTTFQSAHPGTTIAFNFGSSGALATQIQQGAPADVFASAAPANMATVQQAGDISGQPVTFARNSLEIVVKPGQPARHPLPGRPHQGQRGGDLRQHRAVRRHRRPRRSQKAGVTIPTSKVTLGPDVDHTLAEVTTGDADAAIVYVTNAKTVGAQGVGIPIPASVNVTTSYPIAVVKGTRNPTLAQAWIAYVLGPTGQKVLQAASFLPPTETCLQTRGHPDARASGRPGLGADRRHRHGGVPGGSPDRVAHQGLVVDPVVGPDHPGGRRRPEAVAHLLVVGHRPVAGVRRPPGLGAGPHPVPGTEPGAGADHPAHGAPAGRRRGGPPPRLRPRRDPRPAPLRLVRRPVHLQHRRRGAGRDVRGHALPHHHRGGRPALHGRAVRGSGRQPGGRPVDDLPAGHAADDRPLPGRRDRARPGPGPSGSSVPPSPSPATSRGGPRPSRWPSTWPSRRTSTWRWPCRWPSWPSPSWSWSRCGGGGWAPSTREPRRRGRSHRRDASSSDSHLEVADGEVVAVLGPNGSGKSTLLRALAGLQPLSGGRIVLDGVVLDDPVAKVLIPPERRPCGMVFQDYLLFPHLTAVANVAFGPRSRGVTKADANAARPSSGSIGWAWPTRPRPNPGSSPAGRPSGWRWPGPWPPTRGYLLLDEPMAALDAGVRGSVRHQLRHHLRRVPRIVRHGDPRPARRRRHRRSAGHHRSRAAGAAGDAAAGDHPAPHRATSPS